MAMNQDYQNQLLAQKSYAEQFTNAQKMGPISPFERLSSAVEALDGISKFASTLADKLVGAKPEAIGGAAIPLPPCDGLLGSLDEKTNAIREIGESIEASLRRIEQRI